MDDIVRASGTSKGAVYHHFQNKEAVFLALVDEFAGRLALSVSDAITHAPGGALPKVESALRAVLETFGRSRDLARLILLETVSLGPAYAAKRAEVHARFAALIRGYLDEAVADGAIPAIDTRVATLAWLGAVNEVVLAWLMDAEDADLGRGVPALTALLLRSIGAAR